MEETRLALHYPSKFYKHDYLNILFRIVRAISLINEMSYDIFWVTYGSISLDTSPLRPPY